MNPKGAIRHEFGEPYNPEVSQGLNYTNIWCKRGKFRTSISNRFRYIFIPLEMVRDEKL